MNTLLIIITVTIQTAMQKTYIYDPERDIYRPERGRDPGAEKELSERKLSSPSCLSTPVSMAVLMNKIIILDTSSYLLQEILFVRINTEQVLKVKLQNSATV